MKKKKKKKNSTSIVTLSPSLFNIFLHWVETRQTGWSQAIVVIALYLQF